MTISRGDYHISVQRFDGLGKRIGLYVGYKNRLLKVGCFSNDEKASIFTEWICHMTGLAEEPEKLPWQEDE